MSTQTPTDGRTWPDCLPPLQRVPPSPGYRGRRGDGGRSPVPPRPVTVIAGHVNAWGRVVVDPTLPHADVAALEERSLRYTLQALREAAGEAIRGSIRFPDGTAAEWWRVNCVLQEAQAAVHRTALARTGDDAQADQWWYIALLHLCHARTLWKETSAACCRRNRALPDAPC